MNTLRLLLLGVFLHGLTMQLACADDLPAAPNKLTFEKDVRPILKAHCFHCHGEGGVREGDLDLRLRRLLAVGGDSGPAITPGRAKESHLLERLRAGEMPPGDKALPEESIETIARWIQSGAETARPEPKDINPNQYFTEEERDFWFFRPIQRPAAPMLQVEGETAIDAFVAAKHPEGLSFSPRANRATLIRRLTMDLHGLPPTPEAVERFLNDTRPDAYEQLVDRLLASPRYGERWGRHWLDLAGYADSEGYTDQDTERPWAFRYRDYVIRSLNSNLPLDRFVVEQLAGDELVAGPHRNLSEDDASVLAATGFLRMAPDGTGGGGVDQPVARNQVVADTLEIVSTSLLGLTVACARCHDHRYDPIPQLDYYRMRAIFEPALDWKQWKTPAQRRISLYNDADRKRRSEVESEARKVDDEKKQKTEFYIARTLSEELETTPENLRDKLREAFTMAANNRTPEQKALLKEYPSVANISAGSLYLYDRRREAKARKLDAERPAKEKQLVQETRDNALQSLDEAERIELLAAEKANPADRSDRQKQLLQKHPAITVTAKTLAKFNPDAAATLQADREVAQRLRKEKAADDLKRYTERAAKIREKIPQEGFIRALTEPHNHAPNTFVFHRGDHEQLRDKAEPGDLSILGETPTAFRSNDEAIPTTGRRLAFAKHLTSGRHPLLARVLANRVWALHFGRGLVPSLGDFGALGARPSHPALLDWLADELQTNGWDLKRLHRLMVLSKTYQQRSTRTDAAERLDPDNVWLSRMSVRRLRSESVRDSVLFVAGQLNNDMYGPPVPVMEDEVGQIVIGKENLDGERKPTKTISLNGGEFRRSLYIQVRRSRPLAVLETFDTPAMTPNCTSRPSSNVAQQPLLMMNSGFIVDYSQRFAQRVLRDAEPSTEAQARLAWKLAYGQDPEIQETSELVQFLHRQAEAFRQARGKVMKTNDADRQAALAGACQALLSSNRFLYID